ncbi:PQQ-dependent sugar dehydrogenase [Mesorhizobium xinjiangense]|uniref:PQQ-dependent sugar dehydrogenase n=1 Tax=Mesorhizobium xinjiangense TaxID=2678685 RepID=UPI0012EE5B63|nr:PQQ-dependent sugar dehydrogenase [Mesorhizobium xinjiangense]
MNRLTFAAAVFTILASAALLLTKGATAQTFETQDVAVQADVVVDGLEHPWGLAFLPDGGAIVTERPGRIRLITDDGLSPPLAGVPRVAARGQGGLLDIALARDFAQSGEIHFSYSQPGEGGAGTAIARARLVRDGREPRLDNVETIFSMTGKSRANRHFGSRIVVAPDGTLFFTIGDRGDSARAQDMADHAGAVLRINPDGTVPSDNPSPDGARHLPEIWSKGHRNPQGAAFDPVTQSLWVTEHGARGGDELNQPQAGRNYGWPVISYGVHYSGGTIGRGTQAPGYEQPHHYWDPSIAPSGLAVYQGAMFPEWQGDFLAGALKFQLLARLARDDTGRVTGEERLFEGAFGRIRDVDVAPDGSVWLLTDEADGKVIRLTRAD